MIHGRSNTVFVDSLPEIVINMAFQRASTKPPLPPLSKADSCSILFQVNLRIFTEASGYLVPNIIRFGQNRVLWGLFVGKNCSSEILSSIKSHQMFFFAGLFQLLLKVIENVFTRDLGGILQLLCMGYRLGVCGL